MEKIAKDFINLLENKRRWHLAPYIHCSKPALYEDLINSEKYYLSKIEHILLTQRIKHLLSNSGYFDQILEIGPGSRNAVNLKTIPFIKNVKSISRYIALDINKFLADDACVVVKEHFSEIETLPIKYDFSCSNKITQKFLRNDSYTSCLCFFGSTFSNLNDTEIMILLKNFRSLLAKNNYLFLSADFNANQDTLKRCYSNNLVQKVIFNVMYFLKEKFALKGFDPEAFKFHYRWNEKESRVELSLESKIRQRVLIEGKEYYFNKGQNYHLVTSRKFKKEHFFQLLKQSGLKILNSITTDKGDPEFSMVLAQKK